jgi:MarR-like DNA-binding transcriptional regulator SgrR of sgrS sRNA
MRGVLEVITANLEAFFSGRPLVSPVQLWTLNKTLIEVVPACACDSLRSELWRSFILETGIVECSLHCRQKMRSLIWKHERCYLVKSNFWVNSVECNLGATDQEFENILAPRWTSQEVNFTRLGIISSICWKRVVVVVYKGPLIDIKGSTIPLVQDTPCVAAED